MEYLAMSFEKIFSPLPIGIEISGRVRNVLYNRLDTKLGLELCVIKYISGAQKSQA